jgi:DinB family protein
MKEVLNSWYNNILKIESELSVLNNNLTHKKPAPNKWAANEILGHLIDSAINNHRRFVLMQIQDNLIFDGYNHNKWVELQNYIKRDWQDILDTWVTLNINLIESLEEIKPESWAKEFTNHSLHLIAWQPLPQSQPATMAYLVKDYFGHINHHLKQIYNLVNLEFVVQD